MYTRRLLGYCWGRRAAGQKTDSNQGDDDHQQRSIEWKNNNDEAELRLKSHSQSTYDDNCSDFEMDRHVE